MSSSDINIDELTKEVNSNINSNDNNQNSSDIFTHIKKCIHTPLIYITTVPLVSAMLIFLMKPNYIYDKDIKTKQKKLNTTKYLKLIALVSIIMNVFIYFYLIKQCKMKI